MIDYEKLKERIETHKKNIASGSLKFDNDSTALGYIFALDDVLKAMDELRMCWSTTKFEGEIKGLWKKELPISNGGSPICQHEKDPYSPPIFNNYDGYTVTDIRCKCKKCGEYYK